MYKFHTDARQGEWGWESHEGWILQGRRGEIMHLGFLPTDE